MMASLLELELPSSLTTRLVRVTAHRSLFSNGDEEDRGLTACRLGSRYLQRQVNAALAESGKSLPVRSYVPISHDARYFLCSFVSRSISTPIPASFRRAISLSISTGTGYTFFSSFW